ncbi:MAG: alpha/beta hydrolase [Bacteroidota bacterium]
MADIHFIDIGKGPNLIFQHGLGGSSEQVKSLFPFPLKVRLVCLDCPGHGRSSMEHDPTRLNIPAFADDIIELHEEIKGRENWSMGGVSMGAAIALQAVLKEPERFKRLILLRPAWLNQTNPENLNIFHLVADQLETMGPHEGKEQFKRHPELIKIAKVAPAASASLLRQFQTGEARAKAQLLRCLVNSLAFYEPRQLSEIQIPVHIFGCKNDPLHPWEMAERYHEMIPDSTLVELPSRYKDLDAFQAAFQDEMDKLF